MVLTTVAAFAGVGLAGGGAVLATLQPDKLSQDPRPFDLDPVRWQAAWDRVLHDNVDPEGRINFTMSPADRQLLRDVVSFAAIADPNRTSGLMGSRTAIEAYYLNVYNALAMYGIVTIGIPARLTAPRRLGFFVLRKVRIAGRPTTLYRFENDVVRKLGDPRIHFALNCMTVGCPRLRSTALTASNLNAELDAAARNFINDPVYIQVDTARGVVKVSEIFKFYSDDFLSFAPSLIEYINLYRRVPISKSFRVEFLEYDWTVNMAARRSADGR